MFEKVLDVCVVSDKEDFTKRRIATRYTVVALVDGELKKTSTEWNDFASDLTSVEAIDCALLLLELNLPIDAQSIKKAKDELTTSDA